MSVTAPCGFFPFVCVCLRVQHTKFHRLQTKTFRLRVFVLDRAKFLRQSVVSDGSAKTACCQFGSQLLHGGKESGCRVVEKKKELWKAKVPLKNIREQLNMSKATLKRVLDGRQPLPAVPGGVHAQEAAGGHQQGWQHHQVLGRGPVHPPALFRAKIASI